MVKVRGSRGGSFLSPTQPKLSLKRETSVWSDVSQASSVAQHREAMLNKAFGSQLDVSGNNDPSTGGLGGGGGTGTGICCGPREDRGSQTCDELLDPLIPRMRRRVARAVREGALSKEEGRQFFTETHGWMQAQVKHVIKANRFYCLFYTAFLHILG